MTRTPARIRILNAEPENYSGSARKILDTFADVDEYRLSAAELREKVAAYDVLLVRLGHRVDRDLLEVAPRLKIIVSATTGLDHIDVEAANQRHVEVLSLQGERAFLDTVKATAEHTWALLLALARRIPAAHASVLAGQWNRNTFVGSELNGRTLGIVGYGRLGTMVARFGVAFGMQVCACDPAPRSPETGVELCSLDELITRSDVVSVHVPLSATTAGLISQSEFAAMKPQAWLINTSRGGIVDEDALLAALTSGRLGGAALDVLFKEDSRSAEWLKDHPLVSYASQHHNLVLTPHVGGATIEAMETTEIFLARKLRTRVQMLVDGPQVITP